MNIKTISVCVNYLDLLSYTWPLNKSEIQHYTIITDSKDIQTQEFCKKNNINLFITDAFYNDNHKFSKSSALNAYFKTLDIYSTEWILLLDSDIVLNNALNTFQHHLKEKTLDSIIIPNKNHMGTMIPMIIGTRKDINSKPRIIYNDIQNTSNIHGPNDVSTNECLFSCAREIYESRKEYKHQQFVMEDCFFYGYFHLFHVDAIKDKLINNELVFNTYATAAEYDMDFAREYWAFPQRKTLNVSVHHLGPIEKNWKGRKSRKWKLY